MVRVSIAILLVSAAGIGACAESVEPVSTAPASTSCYDWGCTGNSPVMGPFRSHEFHTGGLPNAEGLRVDGFWIGGTRYTPVVEGDRFYAWDGQNDVKAGAELVDGYFRILDGETGAELRMTVTGVSNEVTFWLGDADRVQTYELSYVELPSLKAYSVCANPPDKYDGSVAPATWDRRFEAILFTGDRYDGATKQIWTVGGDDTTGWFNIGCAGSALAKLHLNRHTTAGAKAPYDAKVDARQSLLNAFTANLCGTGTAFTEPGMPLRWINAAGWKSPLDPAWDLEAVWGPDGAVCVDDVYRLPGFDPSTAPCASQIPHCRDLPGYDEAQWKSWGVVRTAVP